MFVSLGMEGFAAVQQASSDVAQHIASEVAAMGPYRLITDGSDLPVFAFTLADPEERFTVYDLSSKLREWGWQVPAYTMPPNREDLSILRVVVRNGLSHDMADMFLADLQTALDWFDSLDAPMPHADVAPQAFKH
jgi:glutamate decarboxylase